FGSLHVGPRSRVNGGNWFAVADNGARAVVTVDGGGVLSVANWAEVGEKPGSDGRVIVTGSGSRFIVGGPWMDLGGAQGHGVLYVGAGAAASISGNLNVFQGGEVRGSGTV